MSTECEEIFNSLLINRIPLTWAKICYPSHKPLMSWYNDLLERIIALRAWFSEGHPACFWMSGLFFPQGFITGVLQNHARVTKKPINCIEFKYSVLKQMSPDEITEHPPVFIFN